MPPLKGEVPAAQAVGLNHADFGRFNLWRPTVVARTRGSKWLSALPTAKNLEASIYEAEPPPDRGGNAAQ